MKNLNSYFQVYKKNVDNISSQYNEPEINANDYFPKIGIADKSLKSLFIKLGVLSLAALVLIGLFSYYFIRNAAETYENLFLNILSKINLVDDRNDLDYINITGINYIELSDDELSAIGIIKKGDNISIITEEIMPASSNEDTDKILDSLKNLPENVNNPDLKIRIESYKKYAQKGYDTTQNQLIKSKYNISFYTFNSYTMHYDGWEHDKFSEFSPVSIQSFGKGKFRYRASYLAALYSTPSLEEYKSGLDTLYRAFLSQGTQISYNSSGVLSRLVPVKIKLYNKNEYKPDNKKYTIIETEIVLWYAPTEKFINALPERYSGRMRNELEVIEKIEKGEIKKEEACSQLEETRSILGLCPVYHDNLEIKSIYPSPGREDTHIKFSNGIPQKLSIYLYNLRGDEIQRIADKKFYDSGEYDIWIDLSKLQTGIYPIIIIDEDGNAISSKLIKE
ncbi:MAG: T9SS type A sorting domain-containing protein [Candidatus Kapabacteria bacterium]|nr:T9SS type A sorting domain-containing protein [Ignavibacteriota bacterium]MCW5884177.1 T9SS type A sorting domain-containing protein [Candidatus Kapabacteria bacterium]